MLQKCIYFMQDTKSSQWCCWEQIFFCHCLALEDDVTIVPRIIRNHLPFTVSHPSGTCGAYGGGERCAQGSSGETWGNPDIDGRIILRWIFGKWEGVETGWSWLRTGTGGGHLWIRWRTFGFHKLRGISWLAAEPVSFSRRTLLHGVSK